MALSLISQADLARKLKLSSATISLALADHPRIPLETRKRVRAMADKFGYKTDLNAANLAAKRWAPGTPVSRANIAYTQCRLDASIQDLYLPGLLKQADALGYHLDVFRSWEFTSEDHLSRVLYSRGIKGVIVGQSCSNFRPYLAPLDQVAVVQCGLYMPVEIHTLVRADLDAVVRLCFEKVRSRGFHRIGMVLVKNPRAESDQILESSIWNMKRLYPDNIEIFVDEWEPLAADSGSLKKWFHKHRVDVVIGVTAIVDALLQQSKIEVPFAAMLHDPRRPQYDGSDIQSAIMGEMAINLLDSYLRQNLLGIPPVKRVYMVEPTWREGTSLSRPRISSKVS